MLGEEHQVGIQLLDLLVLGHLPSEQIEVE